MINSSSEEDFDASVTSLRRMLQSRGYPPQIMPDVKYDATKREEFLTRLRAREFASSTDEVCPRHVVFKCQYGAYLKPLRLQKELTKLYQQLRVILGSAFLEDVCTRIAHPVSNNLFTSVHRYNFVLPHLQKQL